MDMNHSTPYFFWGKRWLLILIIIAALALALGIRLYDLTDLPLDFHPTRQLFSAFKARGMYYLSAPDVPAWKRQIAIQQWQEKATIEPPLIETLVAWTYRFTGEKLWVARIYSSIFWLLGGLALFLLARDMTSPEGALAALLYYLFVPYGVIASRSFQPDPLMVALIVWGLWGFYRWYKKRTWRWLVTAGILSGLAIFAKNVAVFPIFGAFAAVILFDLGFRKAIKDRQVWVLAVITALPTAVFTIYGMFIAGFLDRQFAFRFFPNMLVDPSFYLRWDGQMNSVIGYGAFLLAMFGIFLASARSQRSLLIGLWCGYFIFGLFFPYHFITHDYYHLPLIPIVALSLAPAAQTIFDRLTEMGPSRLTRLMLGVIVFAAVGVQVWSVRNTLTRDDYRSEEKFWVALGDILGHTSAVASISQNYGYRLAFWGWQDSNSILTTDDLEVRELAGRNVDPMEKFQEKIKGEQFFIVTAFSEFDRQPDIKDYLNKNFPIYAQGKGYIIFDLQHPLDTTK
jgi:4-amino-4-deoxy-L-arabinose transferase-like glycosyltransferase